MKTKNLKKSISLLMVALVSMTAGAQVVNGTKLSSSEVAAYLNSHPSDSVVMALKEVEKSGASRKVERTLAFVINGRLSKKTDTFIYKEQNASDVALATKEAVLRGEAVAYQPEHHRADGSKIHRINVSLLGGANYVDNTVAPEVTLRLGYETCHFLFEVEGSYTTSRYNERSDTEGSFAAGIFMGNLGWKLFQGLNKRSYVAVVGAAGYGYSKTNSEEELVNAHNYGFTFAASLRGALPIGKTFHIIGEGGWRWMPSTWNDVGSQDLTSGPFARLGVGASF